MSPAATDSSAVVLTARQIDTWPEAEGTWGPPAQWTTAWRLTLHLPPKDRAVPVCRDLARQWLTAQRVEDGAARHLVLTVLSELFTNALRHSTSTRITCGLWRSGGLLFVEIRDQGGAPSTPRLKQARWGQEDGRGLTLVAEIACVWGSESVAGDGRTVWAAVPVMPAPPRQADL